MAKFLVRTLTATAAVVSAIAIASTAQADEPPTTRSAAIPEARNEIFFSYGGSFNINRSLGGQLGTMFGLGGFPEQDIMNDSYAISNATKYLLEQQNQSDPTIRVPDLMNPYQTSVQFLPTASAGAVSGVRRRSFGQRIYF